MVYIRRKIYERNRVETILDSDETLQLAHEVPGTSLEGPLNVLTSATCRGPSGDSQGHQYKSWWFNEKICFLGAIVLVLHVYSCFLQEEQIFRSSKRGYLRDVYETQLRDVLETKWWDALGTCVGNRSNIFFKFNSQTH